MMPSSKASLEARLGLFLFLAADFMVFAGLLGAGIVLREGVSVWVTPLFRDALRSEIPIVATVIVALSLVAVPWKGKAIPSVGLALAFVGIALESVLLVQKGIAAMAVASVSKLS